ncbi:hypothetical protein [Corynebacterium sp.]|nr:hypothetical protein [Corynebacterium sp.]
MAISSGRDGRLHRYESHGRPDVHGFLPADEDDGHAVGIRPSG